MRALITGGCGFIGSNFVRMCLKEFHDFDRVINLDALTYAGNPENLWDIEHDERYRFVRGDIADAAAVERVFAEEKPQVVINFAAETHVDRSIEDSQAFVKANVLGTQVLLEAARRSGVTRFLQVSTDEVYGSLGATGSFTESTPLAPRSPYSATKAAADHLVAAYHHTYGMNTGITRCSNNYGPYQFPEKLIPLMILNAFNWRELPVYGDGMNVRDWLHVSDHCRALELVLAYGEPGGVYNIGGGTELPNLVLVKQILKSLDRNDSLIRFIEDRPGHDRRYSIDSTKLRRDLGWEPKVGFEEGLQATVDWYLGNADWVMKVTSGDYLNYYDRTYADRLKSAP